MWRVARRHLHLYSLLSRTRVLSEPLLSTRQLLKTFDQHKRTAGRSRDVIQWQAQIRSSLEELGRQLGALQQLVDAGSAQRGGAGSAQQQQQQVSGLLDDATVSDHVNMG